MKKSIIAGAGVVALSMAALPFAGVFAVDTLTVKDSLTLTVSSSCTYDGITPEAATSESGNPYTASAAPNQMVSFTATSSATSLTVKCNDADGYKITPTFTGLTGPTGSTPINYQGSEPVAGTAGWTAYYSKNSAAAAPFTASGASGAITSGSTMTDTYSFSYKVATDVNQAAGDYTGTATYALAAN